MEFDELDDNNGMVGGEAQAKLDDFNAELSGTKAGYIYTTSAAGGITNPRHQAESEQKKSERQLSELARLLAEDPAYATLYNDTIAMVSDAAAKADAGIEAAEIAVAEAQDALSTLEDTAARTPDGRLAFRTEDGRTVDKNGNELDDTTASSIVWPNDVPSYKEYRDRKDAVIATQDRLRAWRDYQALVGDAQHRLADEDNPLKPEELQDIQRDIEAGLDAAMLHSVRPAEQTHNIASPETDFALPTIST